MTQTILKPQEAAPVERPVGHLATPDDLLSKLRDGGWELYRYRDEARAEIARVRGPWLDTFNVERALVDAMIAEQQLEPTGTWSSLRRADCYRITR
jgi:hypothetical protein